MATLPNNPLLDALEDELLCQICVLSNDLRELPCQHSYCVECINKMKHMFSKRLTCPECRTCHKLPKDKADGFPPNRLACRLNEALARHKVSGGFTTPEYMALDNGSSVDISAGEVPCRHSRHQGPTRGCDVYCHFCRNPLCARCGLMTQCANHRNHECEDIEIACNKARKTLLDCKDILELDLNRILCEIERINTRIEVFQNNRSNLQENLVEKQLEIERAEQLTQLQNYDQLQLIHLADKLREQNKEFLPSSTQVLNSTSEYHRTTDTILHTIFELLCGLHAFITENPVLAVILFLFLICLLPYSLPTDES